MITGEWWQWLLPSNAGSFEWVCGMTPFSSLAWPVGGGLMYLLLLYALARCREGKPAVDVLPFSRIHNLFLVILSLTLSYGVWSNVVRFYSSWLNVNIEVLEEARRHNDPSTNQFNWYTCLNSLLCTSTLILPDRWELYLSPWYSLCCHRWCTMQPHVKDSIAAGTVSAEVAASWCPDDANPTSGELYWWLYVTYLFKYYDMVDTVRSSYSPCPHGHRCRYCSYSRGS